MWPWLRLGVMLGAFVLLTALGIWWALPGPEVLADSWQRLGGLPWQTVVVLVLLAAGLIGAEMLRLITTGRALGVRIGGLAALDATVANKFFSWITPGSALGEPAATYMLSRHGVPWDGAVVVTFAKFAVSFVVIFAASGALLAAGLGPRLPGWVVLPVAFACGLGAVMMGALVIGAFRPDATTAWLTGREARLVRLLRGPRGKKLVGAAFAAARGAVLRLAAFRANRARGVLAVLAGHVLYYGSYAAILCVLAAAFGTTSVARTLPRAILYQGFLYVAPTPGGAGLGEGAAGSFFGDLLGGQAFAVVILFRAFTFYLHVALGMVYLPLRGAMRGLLALRRSGGGPSAAPGAGA